MNGITLVTKDGQRIEMDDIALPSLHCVKVVEDIIGLSTIWSSILTADTSEVTIMNGEEGIMTLHNVAIDSVQAITNPDGSLTAHFYMRER